MGRLRLLESAYAQSADLYRASLDFEDVAEAHIELAASSLLANRPDDAILQTQQALDADPNNGQAYLILGRAFSAKQEFVKAADALSHAAKIEPTIETLYSLAISWLSTNSPQGKQRAMAVFDQMKEMAGDSGSLHVLFGRAYRDAEMMPDAVRELQRAIQLDPATPHAHYFLGLANLALNKWKPTPLAESEFEQEIRYYPKDFLANYMLGFLASSQRQYTVADKYMKIAAELDPKAVEPWLYMGLNAYAQGDAKTAEPLLRKAVELTARTNPVPITRSGEPTSILDASSRTRDVNRRAMSFSQRLMLSKTRSWRTPSRKSPPWFFRRARAPWRLWCRSTNGRKAKRRLLFPAVAIRLLRSMHLPWLTRI